MQCQYNATSNALLGAYCGNAHVNRGRSPGLRPHQIAFYCLDWDRQERHQQIDVFDADTGALLDSQAMTSFEESKYVARNIRGKVRFPVRLLAQGNNAVVSGFFFD